MIVMTLNCRGLASKPKKLAICRLVSDQSIDVLFLQETMGDGVLFAGNMELLLPGWTFCSVDAKGKSGGLLVGWRNHFLLFLNSWAMDSGLYVALYSIELQMEICFVNIYAPYVKREGFWNNLFDFMNANCTNIIFGGDLNFSMGLSEIWGDRARSDCLSDFFAKILDGYGLLDIVPNVILPTWLEVRIFVNI